MIIQPTINNIPIFSRRAPPTSHLFVKLLCPQVQPEQYDVAADIKTESMPVARRDKDTEDMAVYTA